MLNRRRKSLIIRTLLVCIVMSALTGCGKKPAETPAEAPTAAPTETTAPAVSSVLEHTEANGALQSWELNANVWSSSNGATITLTAIPRQYNANNAVYFVVHLDGEKIQDIPCSWDGTVYTAAADLEAADGYEYECIVFAGQGEGESFPLSDAYDSLVYLKSSLEAYCNLYISDYKVVEENFMVTAGFAHVQLPQLTLEDNKVSFQKAELLFQLNGETIETQNIDLPAGEGMGSHEASLSAISFKMPKMEDDYQLDLLLKVSLSDGQELTAHGGSWYYNNSELKMSAG